jgi:hypothetical protein
MSIRRDESVWLLGRLEYAERRANGEELSPRELAGIEGKGVKGISISQDEVVRHFCAFTATNLCKIITKKGCLAG